MKQKNLLVGATWGVVVGFVAGAVTALLLAPAEGSETRRKLLYEKDHTVEAARRKAQRAMAYLRPTVPLAAGEGEEEEWEGNEEEEGAFSGA